MQSAKYQAIALGMFLMVGAFTGCLGDDDDDAGTTDVVTKTTVKIGLLSPITGPIAVYAPGFEDAANVAITELNAANANHEFVLVVGDSGCDGTTAGTAAQALIDAGVVGIAGAACSGATLGAIEVAKAANVAMVSYATTSPAITAHADDGYLFRVVPSDAQQGQAMAAVATADNLTNPAILYMTNDYGSGLADAFNGSWTGDVCEMIGYDQDATDFSAMVTTVKDSACGSVVMVSYATDGAGIIEEMATQGVDVPILGADGMADLPFVDEFTDATNVDGVGATKPSPGPASAEKTAFEAAYTAAAGNASGIYTAETYDAVMIIAAAAMADSDGDIKDDLATIGSSYAGASGTHTFTSDGDVVGSGYQVCSFTATASDGSDAAFTCGRTWNLADGLADA
jgi:branched-chain amino acid transport system substrate-binding protein